GPGHGVPPGPGGPLGPGIPGGPYAGGPAGPRGPAGPGAPHGPHGPGPDPYGDDDGYDDPGFDGPYGAYDDPYHDDRGHGGGPGGPGGPPYDDHDDHDDHDPGDDDPDDPDGYDDDHEDDEDDPPGATRLREKKARKQRRSVFLGKIAVAVVAVLVLLVTGFAWGTKLWVDEQFRQVDALDPDSTAIVDADKQNGDENFLLVGSDSREGAEAEDGVGDTGGVRGARSDTMMIAHIPADRSRVVVVSFPRDVQIDRPACELWDPQSGSYTGRQHPAEQAVKLNTAYQYGGPRCVTQVVQQLTGLGINHFISIDFNGFKAMVDAVEGVQVCVERPILDTFLGPVVEQPGTVELTGDKALDFVRARHVAGDPTSDYGRIRRQQRFIAALIREAMSNRVLLDPGKLGGFVEALAANTFADNVGVDQMMQLGQSLHGLDAGRVTLVTVPTTGEANEFGNEELRQADMSALFRAIIDGTPLPNEQPAPAPSEPAPSQPGTVTITADQVKVQVLNGTGEGGLAADIARRMRSVGFQVVKVDNAPQQAPATVIRYSESRQAQALTVAAAVPGATLQLDPSMGGAVELVLGNGFQDTVQAPQLGQPVGGEPATPSSPSPLPIDLETVNGADTTCS
ncbi:MAG TPA: LCP family protein, partial [Pseudonocardiaceae bacterium]